MPRCTATTKDYALVYIYRNAAAELILATRTKTESMELLGRTAPLFPEPAVVEVVPDSEPAVVLHEQDWVRRFYETMKCHTQ